MTAQELVDKGEFKIRLARWNEHARIELNDGLDRDGKIIYGKLFDPPSNIAIGTVEKTNRGPDWFDVLPKQAMDGDEWEAWKPLLWPPTQQKAKP